MVWPPTGQDAVVRGRLPVPVLDRGRVPRLVLVGLHLAPQLARVGVGHLERARMHMRGCAQALGSRTLILSSCMSFSITQPRSELVTRMVGRAGAEVVVVASPVLRSPALSTPLQMWLPQTAAIYVARCFCLGNYQPCCHDIILLYCFCPLYVIPVESCNNKHPQ